MAKPVATVAFCYDFDGTLAPGYMQDHAFIPELGMEKAEFWKKVKETARKQKGDQIHAYMTLMLRMAAGRDLSISKKGWKERGAKLPLFEGVPDWFSRQNTRATALGLNLEHYIISSGVREMIEGSPIASNFKKIYASSFLYTKDGVANSIALGINYTNKTQYIFRINKGTLDEWDDDTINKLVSLKRRKVPFEQIAFFGDGETDVPCMRLVTDTGGYPIAVHQPNRPESEGAAQSLIKHGRARFVAPGDYREGSKLDLIAAAILNEIAARQALDALAG